MWRRRPGVAGVDPFVLQIGADIDIDIDFELPPPPADQTLDPNPGARGILQFLMETSAGGPFGGVGSSTLRVTLNGQPVMNEPNLRLRDRRPYYSHIGPGLLRGGQGNTNTLRFAIAGQSGALVRCSDVVVFFRTEFIV